MNQRKTYERNKKDYDRKERITGKKNISGEKNNIEGSEAKNTIIEKYKDLIRDKIDNKFPKGLILNNAISKCYSIFFKRKEKFIIPKDSEVKIINFKHNSCQVLYKGEIYCIKKDKVRKKDKILILDGRTIDAGIREIFVLYPSGKFVEISLMSKYFDDYTAEYLSGAGTYSKTKEQIGLCNFELWLPGSSVFPANTECLKFTKKKRNWFRMDRNYPTFSLNEF